MAIVTFINNETKETGQTLTACAIATALSIEHNASVLLVPTDFNDDTAECAFYDKSTSKGNFGFLKGMGRVDRDITNGIEGLVRVFSSNRASKDVIKSYTRSIIRERLDMLLPPNTKLPNEYNNTATFYPAIREVANQVYDYIIVDLDKEMKKETKDRLMEISNIVVDLIRQDPRSIQNFMALKEKNEFYAKKNIMIGLGKYNIESKYTQKNVARYLKEKNIPICVPYDPIFSDNCKVGKIIDYFLSIKSLTFKDLRQGEFYNKVVDSVARIIETKMNLGI